MILTPYIPAFYLALAITAIISQTVHTYFIFMSFSQLTGWLKIFQAIIFCAIISGAIFVFVIDGKPYLAMIGAVIEIIINVYYYALDYFRNGIRVGTATKDKDEARRKRTDSIRNWWRINWIGVCFAVLIPVMIYVFAWRLIEG